MIRSLVLIAINILYQLLLRPLLFTRNAQTAHNQAISMLSLLDKAGPLQSVVKLLHWLFFIKQPVTTGGVILPSPLMLAAGFVKGLGFSTEANALEAVQKGTNIIPGWRTIPNLVGAVEFGSFTRYPRLGNEGNVIWRDEKTRSLQNRIGLKNPGAAAAAQFLSQNQQHLPTVFGINIAVSPGITDITQEKQELVESLHAFLSQKVYPSWFTLNLSCPNTEDDLKAHQTEDKARVLCTALVTCLQENAPKPIPLWVKVSPNLAEEQYTALMRVFSETGVKAVVATNTLPAPVPTEPAQTAGISGGALHVWAVEAVSYLALEKVRGNYALDIIGCGGVQSGETYQNFKSWDIKAVQYYSALIYRGPLAAAIILNEA